jgi:hypothetical protein
MLQLLDIRPVSIITERHHVQARRIRRLSPVAGGHPLSVQNEAAGCSQFLK